MEYPIRRRRFLQHLALLPVLSAGGLLPPEAAQDRAAEKTSPKRRLRLSLNAYSFHSLLSSGAMSLDELLAFCSAQQFDAVDLTAYYFPGYPQVPADDYLYHLKHQAFRLGLSISGTGVRNDFADPDQARRRQSGQLVKNWIQVAAKLGAPVIRIFSGPGLPEGYTWQQVAAWMVKDIRDCVAFGQQHGVMVAIQNHDDFLKTAAQTQQLLEMVDSDWFGLLLDIGSYRQGDPYAEIKDTLKYAVSMQIKEEIFQNGLATKPDLKRLFQLIRDSGYRGYLPIETLGPGDPRVKVPAFLKQVRLALG